MSLPTDITTPEGGERWSFDRILALLDEQRRTGVLEVTAGTTRTRVHVRKGYVSHAERRDGIDWPVGAYLLDSGTLTDVQLFEARRQAERRNLPVEDVLVDGGVVSADVMKRFIDLQVAEVLYPLFLERSLDIRFLEERPETPRFATSLPVSFILKEAERRAELWPPLRQRVGRTTAVFRKDDALLPEILGYADPDPKAEPLPELSAGARVAFFHLGGARTVEQVARASGLGLFETYRALAELLDAYLITLADPNGKGERRADGPPPWRHVVTALTYAVFAALVFGGVQWVRGQADVLTVSAADPAGELGAVAGAVRAAQVRDAIQLFRLQRGTYPESLQELVAAGWVGPDVAPLLERMRYRRLIDSHTLEGPSLAPPPTDARESAGDASSPPND